MSGLVQRLLRSLARAMTISLVAVPITAVTVASQPAHACGPETDCVTEDGSYRIRMPAGWDGKTAIGSIVYIHGFRGSAAGVMRNRSLERMASDLGLAVIAPNGQDGGWSFPGSPRQRRDEFAFIENVLNDAENRYGIDRERIVATGFSIGGSMVWNLACHSGDQFAGFVPIAGAFWEPLPDSCPSPMPLMLHVHGTADKTVPFEGRAIRNLWRQGDVGESFDLWYRKADLQQSTPAVSESGLLRCERRTGGGGVLELCLHDGGHSIRTEWVERGWREIAALQGWCDPKEPTPSVSC